MVVVHIHLAVDWTKWAFAFEEAVGSQLPALVAHQLGHRLFLEVSRRAARDRYRLNVLDWRDGRIGLLVAASFDPVVVASLELLDAFLEVSGLGVVGNVDQVVEVDPYVDTAACHRET